MSREPRPLAIDAHPRSERGPIATEPLDGRSVLDHHLDQAEALLAGADRPVAVHAPIGDHDAIRSILARRNAARVKLSTTAAPPATTALVLRTDRLYDPRKVGRAARQGKNLDRAVIWRLDTPVGLAGAGDELTRRRSYQVLGHYWALAPARALAHGLVATPIRPNHVTLLAFSLFVGASALQAFAPVGLTTQLLVAAGLALALVLDTSDGHLARLQGTASAFGRWLDGWLDEVAEMALHAAIAWSAHTRTGAVGWLLVGMAYGMGKFIFLCGQTPIDPTRADDQATGSTPAETGSTLARWVRLAGHADLRWHLWIGLAALGRLDLALAGYALYFPLRAMLGAIRKGASHA
ncbi:MAG: CDP-alcohol phosphatidyltransferase family protein [Isosphaeraceae bacterium]